MYLHNTLYKICAKGFVATAVIRYKTYQIDEIYSKTKTIIVDQERFVQTKGVGQTQDSQECLC